MNLDEVQLLIFERRNKHHFRADELKNLSNLSATALVKLIVKIVYFKKEKKNNKELQQIVIMFHNYRFYIFG